MGRRALRPTDVNWFDTWTPLEVIESTVLNANEYTLIASGIPEENDYVHLFADAGMIVGQDGQIDDIIEPIATPFTFDGRYRIDLDLIVLDVNGRNQIFAKDSTVYSD